VQVVETCGDIAACVGEEYIMEDPPQKICLLAPNSFPMASTIYAVGQLVVDETLPFHHTQPESS
jgi:hypothetical protein